MTKRAAPPSAADPVRRQYESYPYPMRDPQDERQRLVATETGNLTSIIHHVFGGAGWRLRAPRVLTAGGGTGDASIYLAQQMADAGLPGEVTHLDISAAALAVAEARAAARGLTNLHFIQASLLDLPRMGLAPFDYVNCSGVLHHLADPAAGLRALRAVLAPDGGIGLMLYAPYGRSGIYEMQDMLRRIAPPTLPDEERLARCRTLLAALPPGNLLRRQPAPTHPDDDAELFDLYLHAVDRPFTVADCAELLAQAGMRLAAAVPQSHYNPENWIADPALLAMAAGLPPLGRAAFVEAFCGQFDRHIFYTVASDNPVRPPDPRDLRNAPVFGFGPPTINDADGAAVLSVHNRFGEVRLPASPDYPALAAAIDGRRTLRELAGAFKRTEQEFLGAFLPFYKNLSELNRLFLRRPLAEGAQA